MAVKICNVSTNMSSKTDQEAQKKIKKLEEYSTSLDVIADAVGDAGFYMSAAGEELMSSGNSELN